MVGSFSKTLRFLRCHYVIAIFLFVALLIFGKESWCAWRRTAIRAAMSWRVKSLAITPSGNIAALITYCYDRDCLPVWQRVVCPRSLIFEEPCGGFSYQVSFDPDLGEEQAGYSDNGDPELWRLVSGQEIETLYATYESNTHRLQNSDGKPFRMRINPQFRYYCFERSAIHSFQKNENCGTWKKRFRAIPEVISKPLIDWLMPAETKIKLPPFDILLEPSKRGVELIDGASE